jgi:anti-sigma factor ChrR (cupin superfamily)
MANSSIPLPDSDSIKIGADDWQPGARAGEHVRLLVDDPRGYKTYLSKVPVSPLGELHAHDEIEQIYVLEGDFYDDDADMAPAILCCACPAPSTAPEAAMAAPC